MHDRRLRWSDDRCQQAAEDQAYERAQTDAIRTANGEDFSDQQQTSADRLAQRRAYARYLAARDRGAT